MVSRSRFVDAVRRCVAAPGVQRPPDRQPDNRRSASTNLRQQRTRSPAHRHSLTGGPTHSGKPLCHRRPRRRRASPICTRGPGPGPCQSDGHLKCGRRRGVAAPALEPQVVVHGAGGVAGRACGPASRLCAHARHQGLQRHILDAEDLKETAEKAVEAQVTGGRAAAARRGRRRRPAACTHTSIQQRIQPAAASPAPAAVDEVQSPRDRAGHRQRHQRALRRRSSSSTSAHRSSLLQDLFAMVVPGQPNASSTSRSIEPRRGFMTDLAAADRSPVALVLIEQTGVSPQRSGGRTMCCGPPPRACRARGTRATRSRPPRRSRRGSTHFGCLVLVALADRDGDCSVPWPDDVPRTAHVARRGSCFRRKRAVAAGCRSA